MKHTLALLALLALTQCTTTVQTKESQAAATPQQVIDSLKAGNERFASGKPQHRNLLQQAKLTADGQHPLAAIVSCIDSRTSSELIFDQGIGDIFNARVAGNVINDDILGSMEYACAAAGSKAVVVVGHTACGAVKGATKGTKLEHLTGLLDKIQPAVEHTPKGTDNFVDRVAVENVKQSVAAIRAKSKTLSKLEKEGKIAIVGAMYHLDTGRVEFLN